MRFLSSLVLAVAASSAANAQIGTFAYNFSGTNTTTPTASITSTDNVNYTVSTASFARGSGLNAVNATNALNQKAYTNSTTPSLSHYVDLSFSVASGTNAYSLQTATYNITTNNSGPTQHQLSYALNGGTTFTPLATSAIIPNGQTNIPLTFSFSDPALGTLSGTNSITFRLSSYLADNSGNGSLSLATNGATPALSVPFFAPVPEPATILGFSALGVFGISVIRKRLKK